MPNSEEEQLYAKTRELSIKEGSWSSVMSGAGDAYIVPYALELKANNLEASFITSLASFLGPIAQIIGSRLIEKYSRKKIVVVGIMLQASAWLLLIGLGFSFLSWGKTAWLLPLFILSFVLYSACGSLGGPAWFSLLGDAVPEPIRGTYFSRRNKITGLIATAATLVASVWLYYAKTWQILVPAFIALFALSALARYISAYYVSRHYVRNTVPPADYYFSFWQFLKKAPFNNFGHFTIYVTLTNLALNIAGPFFAIYLWKELQFNPIVFTLISLSAGLFSLLSMTWWGKMADLYGNRELLRVGSLLMIPASLLWLFSANPWYLALVPQLVTGIGWAAFSLGASNFIYDAVTPERRAICVAYYNTLNGAGVLVGSTIGGLIAQYVHFSFLNIFLFIFLVSTLARILTTSLLLSTVKEVRTTERTISPNPLLYIKDIKPFYASVEFIFHRPYQTLKRQAGRIINRDQTPTA